MGTVASAHLFSSLPGIKMATELVGPLLLKEDILTEAVEYKAGRIILNDKPGFGIEVDMELVKKYSL